MGDLAPLRSHPAKWPAYILDRVALVIGAERRRVGEPLHILDPFAGVGRIHDLPRRLGVTVGVEIEPEWAACRASTIVGDATALPAEWSGMFDVVATSCCYGNRMADHQEARDSCHACSGTGVTDTPEGCADAPWCCPDCGRADCPCGGLVVLLRAHNRTCPRCSVRLCPSCGGAGLSKRYTYRHALGRMPTEGSAATLGWTDAGGKYRALHRAAWAETRRVLVPFGLLILNVKNHVRAGQEQHVMEWHAEALRELGFAVATPMAIPAKGTRHGQNHGVRVDNEHLLIARRP